MPSEAQARAAQRTKELTTQALSALVNAVVALLAFSLLVRLPRVGFLDEVFGLAGALALIFTLPVLWQAPEFGDAIGLALAYAALAGFALFGLSLWLPCMVYWRTSPWTGFGMAFKAAAIMLFGVAPFVLTTAIHPYIQFVW